MNPSPSQPENDASPSTGANSRVPGLAVDGQRCDASARRAVLAQQDALHRSGVMLVLLGVTVPQVTDRRQCAPLTPAAYRGSFRRPRTRRLAP
jgi:hypothetical protein